MRPVAAAALLGLISVAVKASREFVVDAPPRQGQDFWPRRQRSRRSPGIPLGPDWVVYDAKRPSQQQGQHVEYNFKPEDVDKTRVRFDVTVEPGQPMPGFILERASEHVPLTTRDGCRGEGFARAVGG